MLKEGDAAPDIRLQTDSGAEFRLSSLKGKRVVLYFYPKADTPGCTAEACEFRDEIRAFAKKSVVVVGVSPDKPAAQAKFKEKYELPFTLLADQEKTAAEAYGVWREKNMYGKKVMGIVRSTFVIGPDGRIEKIYGNVKAKGHAAAVLAEIGEGDSRPRA
jgi:peroxiredoxin Q/BCP